LKQQPLVTASIPTIIRCRAPGTQADVDIVKITTAMPPARFRREHVIALQHEGFSSNYHHASGSCWSMIFSRKFIFACRNDCLKK
jgi:hypothetical protein